jgi:hypothetical protein
MLANMISTPQVWVSILINREIIEFKLFNYSILKINLLIPSLEKSNVVRSDNRFGISNLGISATMKCFSLDVKILEWVMLRLSCSGIGSLGLLIQRLVIGIGEILFSFFL